MRHIKRQKTVAEALSRTFIGSFIIFFVFPENKRKQQYDGEIEIIQRAADE